MPNRDINPLANGELQALRRQYTAGELDVANIDHNPLTQLAHWLADAKAVGMLEPNAMVVSTVSAVGKPSARVVLLKQLDEGLVFYTNYHSRKGRELAEVSHGAATFFWDKLERQVRVEGIVSKVDRATSEAYFKSRPLDSQKGAIASPQSQVVPDRNTLKALFAEVDKMETDPICPEHWGGYRLLPLRIEFWQGRPSRMHDRIVFERDHEGQAWQINRLAP